MVGLPLHVYRWSYVCIYYLCVYLYVLVYVYLPVCSVYYCYQCSVK